MGYALQQKDAQTAPVQTPVDDAPQKTTPPPQDVVPEENKAAAGGDKDKDDAAKAEAEKKRAAEVTATWQGLLGKWLGGQLAPLVLEHVSVDALNGYVDEAMKARGLYDPDKVTITAVEMPPPVAGAAAGQVAQVQQIAQRGGAGGRGGRRPRDFRQERQLAKQRARFVYQRFLT